MSTVLYHGGNLDVPSDTGAAGLWVTDDLAAARDYAESSACQRPDLDGVAYVYRIEIAGNVATLHDAVPAALAAHVEDGYPAALAYSGLGSELVERGIAAVLVETGDEHPDTGREHRSWWVAGEFTAEVVEKLA